MKKLMKILLLTFLAGNVNSQNYLPFPESDAVWMVGIGLYNAYGSHPVATCDQPLSFGTDTIISGNSYHRLYGQRVCNWLNTYTSPPPPGTITSGTDYYPYSLKYTFRQDIANQKVYLYVPNEQKDTLIYDFSNLVVGQPYPETYLSPAYMGLMVHANNEVLFEDGVSRRTWRIGTDIIPDVAVVIEGIGSTQGFGDPFIISSQNHPFESMQYLHCFTQSGNKVFSSWPTDFRTLTFPSIEQCGKDLSVANLSTGKMNVYPNPVNKSLLISSEKAMENISITDMQGRLVFQQDNINEVNITIDASVFEGGCYVAEIRNENGERYVTKFIKED